jgi:hypothetical protein
MHHLELYLVSLAFQKIVSSGAKAFPLNKYLLTNLGSDSIYQVAMILHA